MLAAASIGAIWSSTSPDFGINVSNLSAEQPLLCPSQRWGWAIWVADGFGSLQPCCHLLAQPSTPELFQLHKPSSPSVVTTDFQLGALSGFSCYSWDIFRWTPWSWWAFIILNMQVSSSAAELSEVCCSSQPPPRLLSHTLIPHPNFSASAVPSFAPVKVSSAPP